MSENTTPNLPLLPPAADPPRTLFMAVVQGANPHGTRFEEEVPLDGHLDGDFYLKLSSELEVGAPLFVVLRLAEDLRDGVPVLRLAAHGKADRVNPLLDGSYEVRVRVLDRQVL